MHWSHVRIEQLVLGAALTGQALPAEAVHLRATDFYHPIAAQLYSDISRLRAEHPQWGLATLAGQVAPGYPNTLITPEMLGQLALRSAETKPEHIPIAVKMVLRDGAEAAITGETTFITATNQRGEKNPLHERAAAYVRLGEAITRRTVKLRDLPDYIDGENEMTEPWIEARSDIARPDWASLPTDARRARQEQERTILSAMITYPETRWAICEWLPDELFSTYSRRNIYRTLTDEYSPHITGTSMEDIHRSLAHLRRSRWNETPPPDHKPETDFYELDWITKTEAAPPNAAAIGMNLFAADTAAYLAQRQQRTQQAPPTRTPDPIQQPPANPDTGPTNQPKP